MNFYSICCCDAEGSYNMPFFSEDEYTDSEFEAVVFEVIEEIAPDVFRTLCEKRLAEKDGNKAKLYPLIMDMYSLSSSNLFLEGLSNRGLKKLKIISDVSLFGPSEIVKVNHDDCIFDNELNGWGDYISNEQMESQARIVANLGDVKYPE